MAQFKWFTTKHKGLRYREHETRKHGVRRDRFYQYRLMENGIRVQESFGWLSEGWTEEACLLEVAKLKQARRTGEGEITLKDRRKKALDKRTEQERKAITFGEVWEKNYLPQAKADRGEASTLREENLYALWIKPVLGDKPISEIVPLHLEKIKSNMRSEGKAQRTIQYALAVTRQVFNHAKRHSLFNGDNPVGKVKIPSEDNRRTRFLSHEEAALLLEEIKRRSVDVYQQCLLALHTGMRAGEIFSLTWECVDLKNEILLLKQTKSGKDRMAYMTPQVKEMLQSRNSADTEPGSLVFPGRNGVEIKQVSDTFNRAVNALGFNEGVTDPKAKVVFHTLRHTHASWLVMNGTDLYTVKELLGHSDFKMTARYAHLGENTLRSAVQGLGKAMEDEYSNVVNIEKIRRHDGSIR
ncbi:site-specific recombinase XerD [Desulfobotulus alkaliphilus]|uniref:Site-specific recombinase XerD n=1 Tax=Desulfobotulus alkaliphilus TaxID=622671 RepID=A0A562RYZ9_9BACT|nr:site-specific integrase [Desulfobotulus alkaliphilus]TWI74361.1 site-specific recombinase XerD [Desulfobotulus alkaliphilus]